MRSKAVVVALIASMLFVSTGCGVDGYSRQAQFTHWHDEDTLVLVYTRQQTMGVLAGIFRPELKTTHVRFCTVEDDNRLECEHQRQLTNMLNPEDSSNLDLQDRWRP